MRSAILSTLALATALAGCATSPAPLQGEFSAVQPQDAVAREQVGDTVRWGGRIVAVHTEKLHSCFEIVGAPLDGSGRPRDVDRSTGRFIACRSGFYEPKVFAEDRELTVSGRVEGFETRKVGDYDYRYPRVAADVVYLWPERREHDMHPHYPSTFGFGWYDPWYRRW